MVHFFADRRDPMEDVGMYAIVETQGKQHKVTEGKILIVDRLAAEEGSTVDLNHVHAAGCG